MLNSGADLTADFGVEFRQLASGVSSNADAALVGAEGLPAELPLLASQIGDAVWGRRLASVPGPNNAEMTGGSSYSGIERSGGKFVMLGWREVKGPEI